MNDYIVDNNEIISVIRENGVGDAVDNYVGYEHLKDKKLAKLWKQAKEDLDAISKYLKMID
jgi:hypothetical protein